MSQTYSAGLGESQGRERAYFGVSPRLEGEVAAIMRGRLVVLAASERHLDGCTQIGRVIEAREKLGNDSAVDAAVQKASEQTGVPEATNADIDAIMARVVSLQAEQGKGQS